MPTTKYALISKTSSFLHASSLRDSAHTHFMVSCHIISPSSSVKLLYISLPEQDLALKFSLNVWREEGIGGMEWRERGREGGRCRRDRCRREKRREMQEGREREGGRKGEGCRKEGKEKARKRIKWG